MTMKLWHWLLAVAALVVPLQAVALDGSSGGGSLTASASLGYCGVSSTGVSCQINVSWSGIEGAERYTATSTLADGSVRDLGTVGVGSGGGSTAIWVPYVGDGTYGVTITAWGSDEGDAQKLDEGQAELDAGDELKGIDEIEPAPGEQTQPKDSAGGDEQADPPPETTTPEPSEPAPEPTDPAPEPTDPIPADPVPEPAPEPEQPPSDCDTTGAEGDAAPCPATAPLG
jgi:hypothetical protein